MTNCVKETLCTSCVHREVCSKKEEYLAAQKAVDDLRIGATETSTGVYLNSIPWIRPVQLQCTYHMARSTFFGFADSTSSTAQRSVLDGVITKVRG